MNQDLRRAISNIVNDHFRHIDPQTCAQFGLTRFYTHIVRKAGTPYVRIELETGTKGPRASVGLMPGEFGRDSPRTLDEDARYFLEEEEDPAGQLLRGTNRVYNYFHTRFRKDRDPTDPVTHDPYPTNP